MDNAILFKPVAYKPQISATNQAFSFVLHDANKYTYIGYQAENIEIKHQAPNKQNKKLFHKPFKINHVNDLPPFQTGWICFLGYEMCLAIEQQSPPKAIYANYPHAFNGYYPAIIAIDHIKKTAFAIANSYDENGNYNNSAQNRLDNIVRAYEKNCAIIKKPFDLPKLQPSLSKAKYCTMVEQAREHINSGAIYQLNIAQHFSAKYNNSDADKLYNHLAVHNPAPYGGFLHLGDTVLVSASPELFFNVTSDKKITTRPMKGTRKRDKNNNFNDIKLQHDLQTSIKDRAENLMIVDLMRNDLSKICQIGSVAVPRLWDVETYSYVHQMTSTITGNLIKSASPNDIMLAMFPSGSVTGAPKINAINLISDIEPIPRGPFCGSMGYIGINGTMQFNVLIRTLVLCDNTINLHTGCGIVADSLAQDEYQESLAKTGFLTQ